MAECHIVTLTSMTVVLPPNFHAPELIQRLQKAGDFHDPQKGNNAKYRKTTTLESGSDTSYDTQPGNEIGLFYNAHEPTQSRICAKSL